MHEHLSHFKTSGISKRQGESSRKRNGRPHNNFNMELITHGCSKYYYAIVNKRPWTQFRHLQYKLKCLEIDLY